MAFWLLGLVGVALLTAALVVLLAVRVPDSAPAAYSLVARQAEEDVPPAPAPPSALTSTAAAQEGRELESCGGSVSEIVTGNLEAAAGAGEDAMGKHVPARRLVLKIVMASSPSTGGGQDGSSLERAQGVMLHLETDGGAESSSTSSNVPQLSRLDSKGPIPQSVAGAQCGVAGAEDARAGQRNAGGDIHEEFVKVLGEIALQSSNVASIDSRVSEGTSKLRTVIINGVEIDEAGLQRLIASLPGTASASEGDVDRTTPPTTVPPSGGTKSVPQTSLQGVMQDDGGSQVTLAGLKRDSGAQVEAVESNVEEDLVAGAEFEPSGLPAALQPLAVLDMPSDGLGCLRIAARETIEDLQPAGDPPEGVSADVAAALAALNLDSMDGDDSVVACGQASSSMTIPSDVAFVKQVPGNYDGEGSGSERGIEELDEQQLTHASKCGDEEDDLEARRREKKKKKKKKQKAKSAKSMAATAAEIERKVIEKLTAEHVRALAEIEVGCSCKSARGASHMISCPYPFTSSGSMVQRKIKEQYDELVRSNAGRTLTLAQVGRFTTCLVEAKTALQQKSETIQRRFTIAKSLLAKADKSSFDRLCGQIYGLEIEQKKLEEDTVVYNRLQEQLKLSPAYQKMLEYGRTHFEMQQSTGRLVEKQKPDNNDISFEELLAQEKKDSFWTKHSPGRASVPVV